MKMIATKNFSYGGRSLRPGEEFDVADRDVKLLAAVNRAKPAPASAPVPQPKTKPAKRDMAPEEPAREADDDSKPRKGRYRRRDVRAEDDATEE